MGPRKPADPPKDREPPFSEAEVHALRDLLKQQEHVDWFWATVRTWVGWGTAILAGIVLFQDNLKKIFQSFLRFLGP